MQSLSQIFENLIFPSRPTAGKIGEFFLKIQTEKKSEKFRKKKNLRPFLESSRHTEQYGSVS